MDITIYLEIAGILVALIVGYFGIRYAILTLRETQKQTQLAEKSLSLEGMDKSLYNNKPTPQGVVLAISNSPPYMREKIIESLIGLKVKWELSFSEIKLKKDNIYKLTFYASDDIPMIDCEVDITKYPQFKIMKNLQKVRVFGEISSINFYILVELKNCFFEFDIEDILPTKKELTSKEFSKESSSDINLQTPKFHVHETIVMFVLQALDDTFFRDRTTPHIAKLTGIDETDALRLLDDLANLEYVEKLPFKNQPLWSITPKGQEYLKTLKN